jgi:hypothetical protein
MPLMEWFLIKRARARSLSRSLAPSLYRSLAPSLPRSLALSLSRSLALSLSRTRACAYTYGQIYANSEFWVYDLGTVTSPPPPPCERQRESLSTGASRARLSSCYYFRSPIELGACSTPRSDSIAKLLVRMRLPHPGTPVCGGGGKGGGGEIRDSCGYVCGGMV